MKIDKIKLQDFEQRMKCRFHDDGEYAEMAQPLKAYKEQTKPIDGVTYGYYHGDVVTLQNCVREVDDEWVEYFPEGCTAFCAFLGEELVSFCLVDEMDDGVLSGDKIGSIGCVGTVPKHRGHGIALRMVDLAAIELQKQGMEYSYIHYTGIDHWYKKLGYQVLARFSFE